MKIPKSLNHGYKYAKATRRNLRILSDLCLRRCAGNQADADTLYATTSATFHGMPVATQEALLDLMARSLDVINGEKTTSPLSGA